MMHMFYFPQNTKSLEYEADGFQILITHVGTFVELNHSSALNGTDGIGFNLTLSRKIKPYLYQYYLPSTAIVVVSQVSFMIPLSAIPGRVALVVAQFLTLTNIFIYQIELSIEIQAVNPLGTCEWLLYHYSPAKATKLFLPPYLNCEVQTGI